MTPRGMTTAVADLRQRAVSALVLLDLTLGAVVTMQSLAARLAVPVGRQVLLAAWAARHAAVTTHAIQAAAGAGAATAIIALAATTLLLPPRRARLSTAYGSAAWGTGAELRQPRGLVVGRTPRPRGGDDTLRYAGDGHLLTIAPTRSGKGVSAVIPALLTYQGSMIVTDLKGENYAVTARARRGMGQRVVALDPFGVATRQSAAFNPIERIDPTRVDAVDDARALADMLVIPEGRDGKEAFWDEEARALLVGLILHAASSSDPADRSLIAVHGMLTRGPRQFTALLKEMAASTAAGGAVGRAAAQLAQKAPRERSAVLSTAQSHTHFLESPRMADVLGETRIPHDRAGAPSAPSSLYLILPPEHLEGYRRWLRLIIGSAIQRTTRRRPAGWRTLFLLDEFAHLGRMRPVEQGVTLAGAYGAAFWILVQSLAQLRSVYGEAAGTFLANADVLQTFGITDLETAEHLSRLAGEATVGVSTASASRGVTRGRASQHQTGTGLTHGERGRRLITADEVRRLAPDRALLVVRGMAPIAARRADYRRDTLFRGLYDSNPMHAGAGGG
jgi:type IV secretion system protein VirD4